MDKITQFDKLVSEKAYKKCVDKGYTTYSEIALIIGTSDSFAKAVFSAQRKKLNLYHLVRLSYQLHCSVEEFLPKLDDYNGIFDSSDEEFCFLKSIERKK